jgi:phenylpropionate dioxygenase-like ring-hydroxylating dioxygenase large terminal subunit
MRDGMKRWAGRMPFARLGTGSTREQRVTFVKELWYAAAWSGDIGRKLLPRAIIGEPLVLYRTEEGEPVALADTCPHRFAPLHLGRLVGDAVECGYHGLHFNTSGACSFNPHGNGATPKAARVRSFPIAERDGLAWIWMGAVEKADTQKIPEFPALGETAYVFTGAHTMTMPLNSELIIDNLLDLSHAAYLHPATLGAAPGTKDITSVTRTGDRLQSNRLIPNSAPAFVFQVTGAAGPDERVDYWANMRWDPPGSFFMDAGIVQAGGEKTDGRILSSVQIVTPSTEGSSYYFWKMFRNYNLEDEAITQAIEAAVVQAFSAEDEPMIAAVQARMAGRDFWEMGPIMLSGDSAAVQARRIMAERLRAEQASTEEASRIAAIALAGG